MTKENLSKKNWFIIFLFCFMGGVAWNTENMYFNTFITNEIYADVSQTAILGSMEATTAIARMVALSAVAAVLTTFIMGALSDKLKNRKMFISVGYIFYGFRPSVIKTNARLYLSLVSFCFAIIAFQVFYPYLLT